MDCYNQFRVSYHEHHVQWLREVVEQCTGGDSQTGLFMSLRPRPNWVVDAKEWNGENWGTPSEAHLDLVDQDTAGVRRRDMVDVYFASDQPPTTLYQYLEDSGWRLSAYYHDPVIGAMGSYNSETSRGLQEIFYDAEPMFEGMWVPHPYGIDPTNWFPDWPTWARVVAKNYWGGRQHRVRRAGTAAQVLTGGGVARAEPSFIEEISTECRVSEKLGRTDQ